MRRIPVYTLLLVAFLLPSACAPSRPDTPDSQTTSPPATVQPETRSQNPKADFYGDPLPPGAIARMGTVRFRHERYITSVSFSPDGKTLASGSTGQTVGSSAEDYTLRLWELSESK